MAMDNIWGTTVRNKDEELKTFWESSGISYGGLHEEYCIPGTVVVCIYVCMNVYLLIST